MLVCSLPKKSRKRLARDVFDNFATSASLAHDVTDTDRTLNVSIHSRVFVTVKHRCLRNRT